MNAGSQNQTADTATLAQAPWCPTWCSTVDRHEHDDEFHFGPEFSGRTDDGAWSISLASAIEGPLGRGADLIEASFHRLGGAGQSVLLSLTTGDARKMAAQLIRLADTADFATA